MLCGEDNLSKNDTAYFYPILAFVTTREDSRSAKYCPRPRVVRGGGGHNPHHGTMSDNAQYAKNTVSLPVTRTTSGSKASKVCDGTAETAAIQSPDIPVGPTSPNSSTLEAAVAVSMPPKQDNGAAPASSTAEGGRSRPVTLTRSLAEDQRVPPELTPSSMTMPFHLRFYRKKRAVQLKPAEDAQVHFSLAWGPKKELSLHDMDIIHAQIVQYLHQHDWKLSFALAIARGSCTYGRFDEGFEDLLFALRDKYPLCTKKNLAWQEHLGELEPEPRPYAFHITHWSRVLPEFAAFLKSARPGCGKTLHLDVSIRE